MSTRLPVSCGGRARPLRSHVHALTVLLVLLPPLLLAGGAVGLAPAPPRAARASGFASLAELSDAVEAMSARVGPAVVQILVSGYGAPSATARTTSDLLAQQRSTGSGVVVDPRGYIVTNAHVVGNAQRVQVVLAEPRGAASPERRSILKGNGRIVGAQIVGVDRETDLAVLKVQEQDLPYLELGDSDALRQGELVMAFGSPLGLHDSVSLGVVSSVARQLRPEDPMIYIQTDAAINPGNSGGPLVNTNGQVVGINTMIFTRSGGSEGIGFAAPSNIVRTIYEQLRDRGRVVRGVIGVNAETITPTLAAGLGLDRTWGVILADVRPGGPADEAGLRIGDVVLALDGKVMENGRQLDVNIYGRQVGERVTLTVLRGGEERRLRVEVIERPHDPSRFADLVTPGRNLVPRLGILALDLDETLARALPPLRKRSGVVVAARAADAPFWEGGFVPGDVIHMLNRQEVTGLDQLRGLLRQHAAGDAVVVQVERLGQMHYVAFELE